MPSGVGSRRWAFFVAVALLAACDRADTLDPFAAFPQLDAVEDLEIAGLDDDGRAFLASDQMQIAGELVVFLHLRERRVRVADRHTGRALRTLVEPGQMQVPTRLGVIDDAVWIRDSCPDPIFRLFTLPGGSPTEKILAGDWAYEGRTVRGTHLTSQREIIASTIDQARAVVRGEIAERVLLRISGGTPVRLVSVPIARNILGFVRGYGGGMYFGQPFSDDPLYALSPDGDLLAILERRVDGTPDPTAVLELKYLRDDSAVRRSLRYPPRPIERRWIDGIIRSWQGELGMPYSHSEPLLRDLLNQPNHLPIANDLQVDADDRAWIRVWDPTDMIQRFNLRSSPPAEATWLVIDSNGNPAGRVALPTDLRWLQAAGDVIWGAMTADDGTGIILRYRLMPRLYARN
jgi:hypothetical protein